MHPDDEADRLLAMLEGEPTSRLLGVVDGQFGVLHNRAQVLLGLCGVVVTVTGFSGRIIAGTSVLAQWLIIAGLAITLMSAAVAVWGVLYLHWLTQLPGEARRDWLIACLRYRDRKTRAYRVAIVLLLVGLALYVTAIALMLADPTAGALPPGTGPHDL